MDAQQKAALEKVLAAVDAAQEAFRPAVGQRHYIAGLYPNGSDPQLSERDFYSRVLEMETQLMELAAAVANKLHS